MKPLRFCLQLGGIVDLIANGTISGKIAKDVFEIVSTEGGEPADIVVEARPEAGHRYWRHLHGGGRHHCREPRQGGAGEGKPTMLGWLVGKVMKTTATTANPQAVSDILKERLGIN